MLDDKVITRGAERLRDGSLAKVINQVVSNKWNVACSYAPTRECIPNLVPLLPRGNAYPISFPCSCVGMHTQSRSPAPAWECIPNLVPHAPAWECIPY
ncbi:MAG: hypothetical protein ACI9SC_000129 [Gammaproteobacteria bacterium]|jgi:hypothetical protein